ncbi:MAG: cysteine--tRNA ligase, partial [Actinomycetota bacterium]|nr:cysteine--tRNA ligase [Actinomycetota bacterium]
MALQIYDTMQRRKVPFEPRTAGQVSMYVCGPTVYDVPHLGHGRTALTYDVIRRYLSWDGYEVIVASNVTDIDDKIIARAEREGRTEPEVSAEYTQAYDDEMDKLGVLPSESRPHATQFIDGMVGIISDLIERGAAYEVPGKGVYFSVAGLTEYGRLAGRTLDQLLEDAGSRVDVDLDKRSPLDFALWKAAKPGEPTWDTPWGEGRPGWHTECVAMSLSALGAGFDIHGGGDDLTFPHHQNEWAQVEATGQPFARHWVHSAMVNVGGEKMSKSLGNFTNLAEAIDWSGARALRLLALQTHYRRAMEMGRDSLAAAGEAVKRLDAFYRRLSAADVDLESDELDEEGLAAFRASMDDDFGTPGAVDAAFTLVRQANAAIDAGGSDTAGRLGRTAITMFSVLGIAVGEEADPATGGPDDA